MLNVMRAALACAVPVCIGLASIDAQASGSQIDAMYVVLGEGGAPVARVLTSATACPEIRIDGVDSPMSLRAAAGTLPLRTTISQAADTKPSAFPMLTCERNIPPHAGRVTVAGRALPLPGRQIERIVVIGDTGCRIKQTDGASQACNDPKQYPFAAVAAAAAKWKPDLVIHVGDYLYRETACPASNPGCMGSPWGYGWDAWNADFFEPAKPLLRAAPWVLVRGNHESCLRAGQGWWRLLDPRPLVPGRDCVTPANDDNGDFSDPYAVPLGGDYQVIVLDSSNTTAKAIKPGDMREIRFADMYRKFETLSKQSEHNFGVEHHPILAMAAAQDKQGNLVLKPGNAGLQSVFGALNPLFIPERVDAMLSGHVHVWEQVSFSSQHPTQIVAGFSGTSEDPVPLPASLPAGSEPAPGAIVEHFSSWVSGFGYMTLERVGGDSWDAKVWDVNGKQVNACSLRGKHSVCEFAQVPTP